ncbi:outer membrane beta-barrel protein [Oxalicibacterium faecigallinarum]|uniref:Outer membrane protein beta-barrel domain-containing protein n=1 Tax=Oxalicibacterium faecigallinarum TaxID=573741 RepID=A0A8J3AV22_9BURK|nr:outer membrane beta-barrel protein [Oxalicibacterium faecigallinarum]GGI19432.1 hypothetical protein GCM10008066_19050 [Oxalicibacterium faecigallinarum]
MKKQMLAVLVGAMMALPVVASAQTSYVGINVGNAKQKVGIEDATGSIKDSSTGYKIYGGYNFNQNLGIEGGYVSFGKGKVAYDDGTASGEVQSKPRALYAAVTGNLPLSNAFALTAKAGVAFNRVKVHDTGYGDSVSESRTTPMFGVGASYGFSKNIAVVVEYENFGKVAKGEGLYLKANLISAGVRYSF